MLEINLKTGKWSLNGKELRNDEPLVLQCPLVPVGGTVYAVNGEPRFWQESPGGPLLPYEGPSLWEWYEANGFPLHG